MRKRVVTITLLIGICFAVPILVPAFSGWRMPDNQQGYAPKQPIAYSHRQHAGELGIDCRFCHSAAANGKYAGIPTADTCMKCHRVVTSSFAAMQQEMQKADEEQRTPKPVISPELKKLYESLALNDALQPIEGESPKSIPWVRVHNLPDYVCFNHQAHVAAGVSCQSCHGPIESMDRVRQFSSLSMGWCVDCHRKPADKGIPGHHADPSTDCTVCHH